MRNSIRDRLKKLGVINDYIELEEELKLYNDYIDKTKFDYIKFQQEYLGNFFKPECSVKDNSGRHCPEEPIHFLEYNGREIGLCDRCYSNYLNGAFDSRSQIKRHREDRLYIG